MLEQALPAFQGYVVYLIEMVGELIMRFTLPKKVERVRYSLSDSSLKKSKDQAEASPRLEDIFN
jgi:hypothetical protein